MINRRIGKWIVIFFVTICAGPFRGQLIMYVPMMTLAGMMSDWCSASVRNLWVQNAAYPTRLNWAVLWYSAKFRLPLKTIWPPYLQ